MPPSTKLDDIAVAVEKLEHNLSAVQSLLGGWTRGNETNPSFEFLKADQAQFYYPPLESARYRRTTTQVVPPGAWNTIVWDEETWNFSPVVQSTASTGLFTYHHLEGLAELMFTGFIRWQGNSSGERLLRFNEYTTNGVLRKKISDAAPILSADVGQLAAPFTFIHHVNPESSGFDFQVWQNGASPSLDMNFAYLGIIKFEKREVSDSTKQVIITPPAKSIWVNEADPAADQGNSTLFVRTREQEGGGGAIRMRSFVQFNLSAIPAGADVTEAVLHLFQTAETDNTSVANSVEVYRVTSAWTTGITWNTQPGVVSTKMSSHAHPTGTTDVGVEFVLSTAEFAAMISSNYGMRLSLGNEDIGSTNQERAEYSEAAFSQWYDRRPTLKVKYLEA